MAIGLNTQNSSGGDFLPRIQYDARAGRFFKIEREQTANGWESTPVEIGVPFQFVIDLDALEIGWIKLDQTGVDFQMVKRGQSLPTQPSPAHKQGFRVPLYLKDGGTRLWNSTAKCVLRRLDALDDAWLEGRGANSGKMPVVQVVKTVPETSGQGAKQSTNYAPVFEIISWVARPAGFVVPAEGASAPAAPAPAQATPRPAIQPPAQPTPQPMAVAEF